jgi:hypothetical protein
MSSPFISNQESLVSIFDQRNLTPRFVEQLVPIMNPQFARPALSKLIDVLDGAVLKKATNRKFNINRQPNDFPAATIQNRTAVGALLTLTLSDNTFSAIPVGNAVYSTSGCLAEVVAKTDGSMTIRCVYSPLGTGTTAFNAVDFLSGQLVSDRGALGNINNRVTPETVFTLPNEYSNYIAQYDAGAYISHEDVNNKTYIKNQYGSDFYALQKEAQALQRMMQTYYARLYSNVAAVADANKPVGASLINQINTMGGFSRGISGQVTEATLKSVIRDYVSNGGFTGEEIVVLCGSQYLGDIQEALATYVVTSGQNNILGGQEVEGINIYNYGFEGLRLKFIKDPFLDNKQIFGVDPTSGFSNRSRSAIFMNTDMCKTEQGMGVPFVCDYYFGSTADVQRWEVAGSMDSKGNPVTSGATDKKGCQINFTLDKQTQLMNPAACMYHGN